MNHVSDQHSIPTLQAMGLAILGRQGRGIPVKWTGCDNREIICNHRHLTVPSVLECYLQTARLHKQDLYWGGCLHLPTKQPDEMKAIFEGLRLLRGGWTNSKLRSVIKKLGYPEWICDG